MINWRVTKEQLPVIPEGKYGVQILVNVYDYVYEECSPGNGSSVYEASWNGKDFTELAIHMTEGSSFIPIMDVVTHWAYMPEPISCKTCEYHNSILSAMYCSFCENFSDWIPK